MNKDDRHAKRVRKLIVDEWKPSETFQIKRQDRARDSFNTLWILLSSMTLYQKYTSCISGVIRHAASHVFTPTHIYRTHRSGSQLSRKRLGWESAQDRGPRSEKGGVPFPGPGWDPAPGGGVQLSQSLVHKWGKKGVGDRQADVMHGALRRSPFWLRT